MSGAEESQKFFPVQVGGGKGAGRGVFGAREFLPHSELLLQGCLQAEDGSSECPDSTTTQQLSKFLPEAAEGQTRPDGASSAPPSTLSVEDPQRKRPRSGDDEASGRSAQHLCEVVEWPVCLHPSSFVSL